MQHPGNSLPEFQKFHEWLDKEKGFGPDLMMNTVCLQSEVGELANYTGHDLQQVYTGKMIQNIQRKWELKRV